MTLLERLQASGFRRLGSPRNGFRFVTCRGKRVPAKEAQRCKSLVLPPAWTEVRIAPSERSHLQAIGKDKAGRWQYRYSTKFRERRDHQKFSKVATFAESLPKLRAAVKRDLARRGLGREKVMACILKIMSTSFIRPGSQEYAEQNGSYGIATLRRKHTRVHGDVVEFFFPGKSGQEQSASVRDRQVARVVRALLKLPGHEVFKYVDECGCVIDVTRQHINQYIKDVMGPRFSAKDFRTWGGTLVTASALARVSQGPKLEKLDHRARKKQVIEAVKETAQLLGNTPAVSRSAYIAPSVLSNFDKGKTAEKFFESVEEIAARKDVKLHASEKAVVTLLKESDGKS